MKKVTKGTKENPSPLPDPQTAPAEEPPASEDSATEQFNYEVSSTDGIKELPEEGRATTPHVSSTIKILAEKDLPFKEQAPPNHSPYFKCFLHSKNRPYSEGRRLDTNE
ncbi:MAG: hypothetical protein ACTSXO_07640 [Candidatus Heimdallarchaeota archaeon]|nr:hypothetical protein [Candidatus Heimdallarchaeota archaeon]RLI69801.1 MAG: hypothetical protein DRO63_00025 [Candidatus Gerdarchaeota archaeon]RLI72489.1 MAG: hypothetical protein DRP02_01420 [Candidatus Gerdarchaeota archaeon]RLI74268.1 MAG: hypothetical protein DRO91_00960 [Candidatus Heimdallarchaeota archaeon]